MRITRPRFSARLQRPEQEPLLRDCTEPCGCDAEGYAAGKDKAFFEMEMALQDDTHAAGCGCQPCRVERACLQKAMTFFTSGSLVLLDHNHRN